ncbi:MAG: EAL domain-containing protein [Clostridia bacterium]|nr:EAL domain-containing protein [Clostridia bacterium]
MNIYVISLIVVYVSSGAILGMFLYAELTKKRLRQSKQEAAAAYVDALTGLSNRFKFNKVLAEMIKHPNEKFSLCFLDLDDFKHINDNMGHDAGDELLIELGKRLKESLGDHGEVFRLGGDEYALIIVGADTKLEVETIIKRVQRSVVRPILIRGNTVNLEYSLGIARFPEDTKSAVELVNFADTAMYHVKESGKSDYYFHNDALKAKADNKKRMENELKAAYLNKEFGMDYQPRLDLVEPNKIWLEVFLFWDHPMIGKLRAEYFLKYAETTGLIISLDEYILKESIKRLRELRNKGYDNICMAINISPRHFQRKDFIDNICNILEESKIVEGSLMFQITDTLDLAKIEAYKVMLDKIKSYGVKISVNNFTIKHEEMDLFNRLQIDEVKISSEFLVSNSIFKENVLKDLVVLCNDLDYEILITRVSDEETLKKVAKYPINRVQGTFIYPVIEDDKIEEFINEYYKKQSKKRVSRKTTKKTTN